MNELKIVSMVCINGEWMRQEEVDKELFQKLLGEKLDFAMGNQGFKRVKKEQKPNRCGNT